MIVSELIVALQALPQDALVLVDGFDSWEFDYAARPVIERVVPVKQTSHGPAFVGADEPHRVARQTVLGDAIEAIHIGIGEASC